MSWCTAGVWNNGAYLPQKVRIVPMPTLNNHGSFNAEDYAGPTSAVKCHLGIVEFAGTAGEALHAVGYDDGHPEAVAESIGHLITRIIHPTFYLTCGEYTGYQGRTNSTAANTKTVGLCTDPVTLDYWMCKYVMYPAATSQSFMNPDNDSDLRKQLVACNSKGVGTLNESQISVHIVG